MSLLYAEHFQPSLIFMQEAKSILTEWVQYMELRLSRLLMFQNCFLIADVVEK